MSRDGCTLLVSDYTGGSHAIHEFRVADGSRLRVIGGPGEGPLRFRDPCQVWVASDDHVFVVDRGNSRVQVLTPRLDFLAFVGVGQLNGPAGVCANGAVIVVSEYDACRISVFNRGDGALLRRFGSKGVGDGQLKSPKGLCLLPGDRHVAVADGNNHRISVFSVDGEFIRHLGVGTLASPYGVACLTSGQIVVADGDNVRVVVFSASGVMVKTMGHGVFTGVAVHGGTIFAQDYSNDEKCVVFR